VRSTLEGTAAGTTRRSGGGNASGWPGYKCSDIYGNPVAAQIFVQGADRGHGSAYDGGTAAMISWGLLD